MSGYLAENLLAGLENISICIHRRQDYFHIQPMHTRSPAIVLQTQGNHT